MAHAGTLAIRGLNKQYEVKGEALPVLQDIIESASLNLKYPFGLSLSKPCAALRQAQRERFK